MQNSYAVKHVQEQTLISKMEQLPEPVPLKSGFRESKRSMFIHDRSQFSLPSLVDLDDPRQQEEEERKVAIKPRNFDPYASGVLKEELTTGWWQELTITPAYAREVTRQ